MRTRPPRRLRFRGAAANLRPVMSIPIYVINLERSPGRRANVSRQFDALGLDYRFVDAVDGKGMAVEDFTPAQYDRPARRARWGFDLRPGDIAVCLSHEKAMRAALDAGLDRVVLAEDDLSVDPDLPAVLEAVAKLPASHEFVRLYGIRKRPVCGGRPLTDGRTIGRLLGPTSGAQIQVLNRAGMEKALSTLIPVTMPIDVAFDRYWENGLRIYAVDPWPVRESGEAPTQPPLKDVWRAEQGRAYRRQRRMRKLGDSLKRRAFNLAIRAGLA